MKKLGFVKEVRVVLSSYAAPIVNEGVTKRGGGVGATRLCGPRETQSTMAGEWEKDSGKEATRANIIPEGW